MIELDSDFWVDKWAFIEGWTGILVGPRLGRVRGFLRLDTGAVTGVSLFFFINMLSLCGSLF